MRKFYLVGFALFFTAAMVLPMALPAGATPKGIKMMAYVNSFNYEDQQNLPASDGGHVISVALLPDGTTIGCLKIFDRANGMELNGTEFDQTPGVTKFWKENGFNVAEFVVSVQPNANAPAPYKLLSKVKYQIWDHDDSGQHDFHRVSGYVNGLGWFPPTDYEYVLGDAQVHLAE